MSIPLGRYRSEGLQTSRTKFEKNRGLAYGIAGGVAAAGLDRHTGGGWLERARQRLRPAPPTPDRILAEPQQPLGGTPTPGVDPRTGMPLKGLRPPEGLKQPSGPRVFEDIVNPVAAQIQQRVYTAPELVGGRLLESAGRLNPIYPGGPPAVEKGLAGPRRTPGDIKVSFKAAIGGDKERDEAQARMEEIGIAPRIIAAILFAPDNYVPFLGFTKVDDFARALRAIRRGGKTLERSKQGQQLIRSLQRINTEERGAFRFGVPDEPELPPEVAETAFGPKPVEPGLEIPEEDALRRAGHPSDVEEAVTFQPPARTPSRSVAEMSDYELDSAHKRAEESIMWLRSRMAEKSRAGLLGDPEQQQRLVDFWEENWRMLRNEEKQRRAAGTWNPQSDVRRPPQRAPQDYTNTSTPELQQLATTDPDAAAELSRRGVFGYGTRQPSPEEEFRAEQRAFGEQETGAREVTTPGTFGQYTDEQLIRLYENLPGNRALEQELTERGLQNQVRMPMERMLERPQQLVDRQRAIEREVTEISTQGRDFTDADRARIDALREEFQAIEEELGGAGGRPRPGGRLQEYTPEEAAGKGDIINATYEELETLRDDYPLSYVDDKAPGGKETNALIDGEIERIEAELERRDRGIRDYNQLSDAGLAKAAEEAKWIEGNWKRIREEGGITNPAYETKARGFQDRAQRNLADVKAEQARRAGGRGLDVVPEDYAGRPGFDFSDYPESTLQRIIRRDDQIIASAENPEQRLNTIREQQAAIEELQRRAGGASGQGGLARAPVDYSDTDPATLQQLVSAGDADAAEELSRRGVFGKTGSEKDRVEAIISRIPKAAHIDEADWIMPDGRLLKRSSIEHQDEPVAGIEDLLDPEATTQTAAFTELTGAIRAVSPHGRYPEGFDIQATLTRQQRNQILSAFDNPQVDEIRFDVWPSSRADNPSNSFIAHSKAEARKFMEPYVREQPTTFPGLRRDLGRVLRGEQPKPGRRRVGFRWPGQSGKVSITRGEGATEGAGVYVFKSREAYVPQDVEGDFVRTMYREPSNPIEVRGGQPLLDESDIIFEPIRPTDTPWIKANKQAAQGVSPDDPKFVTKVSNNLTRILKEQGYDAVDADDWYVLLDKKLWPTEAALREDLGAVLRGEIKPSRIPKPRGQYLAPALRRTLREAGYTREEIKAIEQGAGPGALLPEDVPSVEGAAGISDKQGQAHRLHQLRVGLGKTIKQAAEEAGLTEDEWFRIEYRSGGTAKKNKQLADRLAQEQASKLPRMEGGSETPGGFTQTIEQGPGGRKTRVWRDADGQEIASQPVPRKTPLGPERQGPPPPRRPTALLGAPIPGPEPTGTQTGLFGTQFEPGPGPAGTTEQLRFGQAAAPTPVSGEAAATSRGAEQATLVPGFEDPSVQSLLDRASSDARLLVPQEERLLTAGPIRRGLTRIGAAITGTPPGVIGKLSEQRFILKEALLQHGVADDTAETLADRFLKDQVKQRWGRTPPEQITKWLNQVDKPVPEVVRGVEDVAATLKNTTFGPLDFAVSGVQFPLALAQGGFQLGIGSLNKALELMRLPHIRTLLDDPTAVRRGAQYAQDGVHQGTGPASVHLKSGTILKYIPKVGKYIDAPVSAYIDTMAKIQFGIILTGLRNRMHEGNLIAMKLTGRNIDDPAVRRLSAEWANAATGASRGAQVTGRRATESTGLTSFQMTRSQMAVLGSLAKGLGPKASTGERLRTALTLANIGAYVYGIQWAVNKQFGNGPMEWVPGKPDWATIKVKGNTVPIIPNRSLLRAIERSVEYLASGQEQDIPRAWAQLTIGRTSPLVQGAASLAGFGFEPGTGRFKAGDLSQRGRLIGALPIPPTAETAALETRDPATLALSTGGFNPYKPTASQLLFDVPQYRNLEPELESEITKKDGFLDRVQAVRADAVDQYGKERISSVPLEHTIRYLAAQEGKDERFVKWAIALSSDRIKQANLNPEWLQFIQEHEQELRKERPELFSQELRDWLRNQRQQPTPQRQQRRVGLGR